MRGGMAEWLNAPVLKTGRVLTGSRGFESHSLRFTIPVSASGVRLASIPFATVLFGAIVTRNLFAPPKFFLAMALCWLTSVFRLCREERVVGTEVAGRVLRFPAAI